MATLKMKRLVAATLLAVAAAFQASDALAGATPPPARNSAARLVIGTSDTMTPADVTVHFTGQVIANRTEVMPACTAGSDTLPRAISDDAGLGALYPITVTTGGGVGTIDLLSSYKLNWPYASVAFQCDGVSNYKVTATSPPTPFAPSLTAVNYPDDTATVTTIEPGRGNVATQLPIGILLRQARNGHIMLPNGSVPQPILAEWANDVVIATTAGTPANFYFDVSALRFYQDYTFVADQRATVFLDPGRGAFWLGQSVTTGQMLQLLPGETVTIRKTDDVIFYVTSTVSNAFNSLPSFTFSQIQAMQMFSTSIPQFLWCSDCRKGGEGAGVGTGSVVVSSGNNWFALNYTNNGMTN